MRSPVALNIAGMAMMIEPIFAELRMVEIVLLAQLLMILMKQPNWHGLLFRSILRPVLSNAQLFWEKIAELIANTGDKLIVDYNKFDVFSQ